MQILSLGAGVQSSTVLLMSLAGELPPLDGAIFADTQSEPQGVYAYLEYLEQQSRGRIPLYKVTRGNLGQTTLDARGAPGVGYIGQPPFYVSEGGRDRGGMLWRKCTKDYKIDPIEAKIRELLGVRKGQRVPTGHQCVQWVGISLDEIGRMRESSKRWVRNHYPLVDRRMTRHDCLLWLQRAGHPPPPKSACVFCPYRSNTQWQVMQREHPEDFAAAVAFDAALRDGAKRLPGVTGAAFVHRSFLPLEAGLEASRDTSGQLNWLDECTGMCGV